MHKYEFLMFGYKSWQDFKASNLGKWSKEILFLSTCILMTFWYGLDGMLQSIEQNVFSPATAFVLALTAVIVDWISGMYRGWLRGEFSTKKAQRILPKLLANATLLAGYFYLHKYFIIPLKIELLTDTLEVGKIIIALVMFGIHALSFISNAAEAELIHGKLAAWVKEKVDKHKNTVDDLI